MNADTFTINASNGQTLEVREDHRGRPQYRKPGSRIWWDYVGDALAEEC